MLDDRHYMRPNYRPPGSLGLYLPWSVWLIIALVVTFALQKINDVYFHFDERSYLVLTNEGLRHGYIWQLLTFQFLHANTLHLFFNGLGIWFLGRYVEARLGSAHFLKLYFLSGVAGGLLQSLLAWIFPIHFGQGIWGASAGVCGLLAAFALIEPEATILAFFVIPIRAKYLLYIEGGIELFFTLGPADGIAHAAHLGGILFAVGYIRWGLNFSRNWSDWNPLQRKIRRERMIKAATVPPSFAKLRRRSQAEETQEIPSEEFISKQVDPILDKISAHGIQSLTERERQILQAARARMSKR